jgi:2'-5' RNA ligase
MNGEKPVCELALIVPVREADGLVGDIRSQHDPSAPAGVPAHITVNYPFSPDVSLHADYVALIASAACEIEPFPFQLDKIREFPKTIYLSPHPVGPFLDIIRRIAAIFPESKPYRGEFAEIIPHLTLAQAEEHEIPSLRAMIAAQLNPRLPMEAVAREIWLIENIGGLWEKKSVFPLGK